VRGCLFVVALAAVLLAAIAWFAAPPLASLVVRNALQSAGVTSGDVVVDVTADPPIRLLTGRADGVRIRATSATIDALSTGDVDLRLSSVDLLGRSYGAIRGVLHAVVIPTGGPGVALTATSVELIGPADTVTAIAHIPIAAARDAFRGSLEAAVGRSVGSVDLIAPDVLTFSLGPVTASARLVVDGGALLLEADVPGRPRVVLLRAGDPIVVTGVAITDELVVTGTIDGSGWLSGAGRP
jgi:hypothetical protein